MIALAALVAPCDADRASFSDDFSDVAPWQTRTGASAPRRVADPRDGARWAMEWKLPAVQPQVYYLQRPLPIRPDTSYTIRFAVSSPEATAVEVQLATDGDPRLYNIVRLDRAGWHEVHLNVGQMSRFGGFSDEHLAGPLCLRLWVDGNPNWAGGAVPRDKEIPLVFADLSVTSSLAGLPDDIDARLSIRPQEVVGPIHPHVYGHFLEHIYHSVEDGLFGELVRNRAFVGPQGFRMQDDVLIQHSLAPDVKTLAGDPSWTDYEFSFRARKTGGREGFLILFRAKHEKNFYWWNLGGWGNVRHALEVEVDDQRHGVGQAVEGKIDSDRWYAIRVRVEGDHLQGWLDGEKLLDVRDATHARGGVGVGTWVTQAEFRDFRVTDLDGNELPVDFGAGVLDHPAVEAWDAYPPGASSSLSLAQTADSPNTGWVARVGLAAGDGARGFAQDRFNIVKGRKYHGRAWLRAEGEVRDVRVALVGADGETLARKALEPRSEGWTECRFTLSPRRSDENGALAITAEGEGALLVDMVSLVRGDSLKTGCRADLLEAVKALKPPIIRWPGGCFASIFRWKRTLGPQHERKPFYNSPWGEWDSGGFGTDEFIRLCRAVDAEPMIVLNLGSWDSPEKWEEYLQDALDWVEYCNADASTPMGALRAANGHPQPYHVTHWELDNETWGMGVEGYAERLIPFARAIKERWPNVTLYACTFWEKQDPTLLQLAGEYFDIISYHLYDNPDNFGSGPPRFESIWSRYPAFIAESPNPDVKLSVTEWNAQSTDWRTGLFAGGLLNVMERLDVVQMASPALFLRRVDAPAWDNAFINHDHRSWFPAPNYVVMKLYRDHYQPTRVAMEAAGPLNAAATRSRDKKTLVLKVVNPTAEQVACALEIGPGFSPKRGTRWVVQADLTDRNTLEEPNRIAPVEEPLAELGHEFVHRFPPYSVTVMELRS